MTEKLTMTEGTKYDRDKTPLHLLPPDALWAIAEVLQFGAQKYDAWNWYKGIKISRLFGACLRHLWQWWRGEDRDPESGLSHVAHAGCMLLFMLQFIVERRVELIDRPEAFDAHPSCFVSQSPRYYWDLKPADKTVFLEKMINGQMESAYKDLYTPGTPNQGYDWGSQSGGSDDAWGSAKVKANLVSS
jgi:hypothetical protein